MACAIMCRAMWTYLGFHIVRALFIVCRSVAWCFTCVFCKACRARKKDNYSTSAHVFNIRRRFKFDALVGPNIRSDFIVTHDTFDNPERVLSDHVSLYDVNGNDVIFVEAEPGCEAWRAKNSCFHKLGQFRTARKLIVMPYSSAEKLANELGDPQATLIFMGNTTRCGSTLLNQIFEASGHCVTLSEPHTLNTLSKHVFKGSDEAWEGRARTVMRLLCKPVSWGAELYFLKFPGITMNIIPDIHKLFPGSRQLFMYRDPLPVCHSFIRARHQMPYAYLATTLANTFPNLSQRLVVKLGYRKIFGHIPKELRIFGVYPQAAFFWAFFSAEYIKYRAQGIDMVAVKYEDLISDKQFAVEQIFRYCGIPDEYCADAIKAFEQDSQEGSPLSRQLLGHYDVREIKPTEQAQCDMVCEYYGVAKLGETCVLPDTITRPPPRDVTGERLSPCVSSDDSAIGDNNLNQSGSDPDPAHEHQKQDTVSLDMSDSVFESASLSSTD